MLNLNTFLTYDQVVIQCHDNPDPDAIASAFALYKFLKIHDREVQIVYSGFSEIRKANLLLMTIELKIPLRFIKKDDDTPVFSDTGKNILVTVDCQYGTGNVKKITADEIAIIDHHIKEKPEPPLSDIRPFLGSCSTLMWRLLKEANFDFNDHLDVGTALYYGLYTDTNSLSEIIHPMDMDLRDEIKFNPALIRKLQNSNLTIEDLTIASKTLIKHVISEEKRYAVFEAEPCDPNILGFTSDLALQVDNIDVCIVFCRTGGGLKLSVRSSVREVMANELAERICQGIGSGGGHSSKAGGFINTDKLDKSDKDNPSAFLMDRLNWYFSCYDHVYCGNLNIDVNQLDKYRKNPIPIGYVRSLDIYQAGTELLIRTLEGDTFVTADPEIYIMVGILQEVWPIKRVKFEKSYYELNTPYQHDDQFKSEKQYEPTVKDKLLGESKSLIPFIRSCVPTGENLIFAKKLNKCTKVFTTWNLEGYMFGNIGDYLAIRADDNNDAYIIENSIFGKTYSKVC